MISGNQISAKELAVLLEKKADIFLLDVRNLNEYQIFNLGGKLIPLVELSERLKEIPTDKPVIVYCHSGLRSQAALELLQHQGFNNVKNLSGGILAWQHGI